MTDNPIEAIAKWMMQRSYATGHGETVWDLLAQLETQAIERERNRCLKAVSDAPALDENGYICEKGQAMKMILAQCR